MTDPRYMRMAKAAKDELGATDVVLLVRGRSGLLTVGHSGPAAERMAYAALDAALDALATRPARQKEGD